jgi:carbamoyl-phosphate synthase large subunit
MAIGRTFAESLQKALRGLETGLTGLDEIEIPGLGEGDDDNAIKRRHRHAHAGPAAHGRPGDAPRHERGGGACACKIDPWFLAQIEEILAMEARIREHGLPKDAENLRAESRWAFPMRGSARSPASASHEVAKARRDLGVRPVFKRIDTCAAEFASPTAYMYSTYETPFAGSPPARRASPTARRS